MTGPTGERKGEVLTQREVKNRLLNFSLNGIESHEDRDKARAGWEALAAGTIPQADELALVGVEYTSRMLGGMWKNDPPVRQYVFRDLRADAPPAEGDET